MSAFQRRLSDSWYTELVETGPLSVSEIVRNAHYGTRLGLPFRPKVADLRVLVRPDRAARAPYFVLFPGAALAFRRWPPSRFAAVAKDIARRTGWVAVVCGSKDDRPLGDQIASQAGGTVAVEVICGETDLRDVIDVFARAELIVTSDTMAVHLGAALGRPTVCISSVAHHDRFIPYDPSVAPVEGGVLPIAVKKDLPCGGCDWFCIHKVPAGGIMPCIDGVTVPSVMQAVASLIE